MFEKYWKPYFDAWSQETGEYLERLLASPAFLRTTSSVLNTVFHSKILRDKLVHQLVSQAGISTYRKQQQGLHRLIRLDAQVEELREDMADLKEEFVAVRTLLETWIAQQGELPVSKGEFQGLAGQGLSGDLKDTEVTSALGRGEVKNTVKAQMPRSQGSSKKRSAAKQSPRAKSKNRTKKSPKAAIPEKAINQS